ncbi:hypothetical protein [Lysinibacillus fusiformis]|uniref:hypothetical protein n=1 Tax=Lysinibacillus fusiformis TaxID=28031 RepID=UPI0004D8A64B|nr:MULTISPECIES: hypothetical protein [Lysinibacillus]KEK13562.1 hypothetical protein EP18_00135 [Lysinibacillus sphaericus]MCK1989389.1 hypothetical protein [Lysinibacillus fusiformis]MCT6817925.1 hypothetical protein [Lysinibacillus fusiformis]MCT6929611.1 hypothetical protein [Lysinibacillus fusiformis]MCT6934006.1 hypothetical protein [Lysinibacillus fusiformis]
MITHNTMVSADIAMTIFFMLGITYNYFYDSFPIQIEYLGNLVFWLILPLSIIIVALSIWLLTKKVTMVISLLAFSLAVITIFILLLY